VPPDIPTLVAIVPPTLMGLAALMQARRTHAEVRTNHGKRAGEYLELLPQLLEAHAEVDTARFDQVQAEMQAVAAELRHQDELKLAHLREIEARLDLQRLNGIAIGEGNARDIAEIKRMVKELRGDTSS
jgi:hypothetical protein